MKGQDNLMRQLKDLDWPDSEEYLKLLLLRAVEEDELSSVLDILAEIVRMTQFFSDVGAMTKAGRPRGHLGNAVRRQHSGRSTADVA
jgi:hypothetical protein